MSPRMRRLALESAGPLAVTLLITVYYWELLLGHFPVSHDHPAHMFNAWLTSDVLIPSGRLTGWTELWFAGYPTNELYGPGGNLWVAAFRYLTFGLLDYGHTYGLAIFGLALLIPMSVYTLGRAWISRTAGVFAGLAMALTQGSWYDLGWFWIIEMGVWPFALGAALTLIALVVLRRYLQRGGPRGLLLASFGFAIAVLGHPMSLLLLGMAGPVVLLHVLADSETKVARSRVLLRAVASAGLGAGLCAFWLVPFVAKSAYGQKLGETWMPLHDVVPGAIQLNLLGPEWRLVLCLAFVGVAVAAFRRHVWALCLASISLVMLLLASSTVLYELRMFDILSPLASIQYPRFLGVVRVFVYLLAGYAVSELAVLLKGRIRFSPLALLPFALALPILLSSGADYFKDNHFPQKQTIYTQMDLGWWPDYLEAAKWVEKELEDEPFSRVGAFSQPYDHVLSTLPMVSGLPVYTGGFLPAHTYQFFFDGYRDLATLKTVGVRYILATREWGRDQAGVVERRSFGAIHVYELEGQRAPERITALGECRVQLLRATDLGMQAVVRGAEGPCRLRIHRSDFPNWRATFTSGDTESPLDIRRIETALDSGYAAFMSVDAPGDGVLTLRWEATRADRAGLWITGLAGIFWLLLCVFSARRRWWTALVARAQPGPAGTRVIKIGVRATVAVVLVAAMAFAFGRSRETRYTFDRHLTDARVAIERNGELHDCGPAEREGGRQCGDSWDVVRAGLYSYVYDSRYCVLAHPSPHGPKHIVFPDVPLTGRLSGFIGLLDSSQGRGAVQVDIQLGDQTPVRFTATQVGKLVGVELTTPVETADVSVIVRAERPAWRHLCFNLQVADPR